MDKGEGMADDVKLRLYVTAIVIVMAILYVSPPIWVEYLGSARSELYTNCTKEFSHLGFSYCWEARQKADLPLWMYLLPFLPVGAVLWLNWLIKPNLKLSDESYPKRTMKVLLWFGLLVAAFGIGFPIWSVVSSSIDELNKVSALNILKPPWVAAQWLIAPLLFHYLVAPVSLAASMKKGKIALLLLAATPIVAGVLYIVRVGG